MPAAGFEPSLKDLDEIVRSVIVRVPGMAPCL
jgi:hypothetical protein